MTISSTRNPLIKYVRSLERSQVRRAEGVYVVEGVRLVGEAIATSQQASLVLYDPDLLRRSEAGVQVVAHLSDWAERSVEVEPYVLAAAAQTETPAGVLAVLRRPEPLPLSAHADHPFGVILDRMADPGNAGAILRTADAAGVGYVVSLPGTVDLFSPKVARAGMGAHFRLPMYQGIPWLELVAALPRVTLVAIDARAGESISQFTWPDRTGLVVGSEAHGLSEEAVNIVSSRVRIPMRQGVESLNASAAASIAIYLGRGLLGSRQA